MRHFPDKSINPVLADNFNSLMHVLYDEIRDFIMVHYYSSNRPEPFWVAVRSEVELPDSLREKLELWRYTFPSVIDTTGDRLFNYWNYLCVLFSKDYFRDLSFPLEGSINKRDWDEFLKRLVNSKQNLIGRLPDHYLLLTAIRQAASQAADRHVVPPAIAAAAGAFRSTVPLPDWGQEAPTTAS